MKCPVVKRYLLRLENPDRPSQAVRDHLSHCPACRAMQDGLLQLENEVRLMPLPESDRKLVFVNQFRGGKIGTAPGVERRWLPWQVRDRARRKLALAASLAAAIVLFAGIWMILHRSAGPIDGPSSVAPVAKHRQKLQRDLNTALDRAHGNSERLAVYSERLRTFDPAGFTKAARDMSEEELSETVGFYQDDFIKGLLKEADEVSVNRTAVLTSLAARLDAMEHAASYAARYQEDNPAKAKQLETLAAAASKGAQDVRALI